MVDTRKGIRGLATGVALLGALPASALALCACFGSSSSTAADGGSPRFDGATFDAPLGTDARASDAGGDAAASDAGGGDGGSAVSPDPGTCVPTGSMATARTYPLYATLPDGRVLVAGGGGGSAWTGAEIYDPTTGTFSPTGSMSVGRYGYPNQLVPLSNGKFLVAGGSDATCTTALATAEVYDPTAGTWSPTGTMTSARYNPAVVPLGSGQVLVRGGYSQLSGACGTVSVDALTTAELYDPTSGTFTATADAATPRAAAASTQLADGTAFIVAGEQYGNSPFNTTAEIFGTDTDGGDAFLWSGTVPGSAGYSFAFLLPSGKVLVDGSYSGGTVSLFDPTARTFGTAAQDLISAGGGCGIRLKSGDVFLATGLSGGTHTPQTELYQASTGTWMQTGSMSVSRWVCAISELPDGNVLVAGGMDASGKLLASAEVCNPKPAAQGDL